MEIAVQPEQLADVFKANMKSRRKELGLTQAQVAERMKIEQPYVAALERGDRSPTLPTLAKLAEALNTTPDALLTREIFSPTAIAS